MGGDDNTVHLVSATGVETWPKLRKEDVARRLVAELAQRLP
jgi:phosphopantothenoylcysteine decarboxylase/phosphopantothenate--cysteine ligase